MVNSILLVQVVKWERSYLVCFLQSQKYRHFDLILRSAKFSLEGFLDFNSIKIYSIPLDEPKLVISISCLLIRELQ